MAPPDPIPRRVLLEAADWFARLQDEADGGAGRAAWRAWLAAHPDHGRAWARVEAVGRDLGQLRQMADPAAARQALDHACSRRRALKVLGLGSVLLVGGMLAERYPPWRRWTAILTADYRTRVGEIRTHVLADGSRLWLNTATAADVDFTDGRRMIHLRDGEVLIETASDPRPLWVATRHGRIRALGTRFDVRQWPDLTEVTVFDGAVEVNPAAASTQVLDRGQRSHFTERAIAAAEAIDRSRAAWSRGVLLADDRRLDEFIAELARYRPGHLSVDPAVAGLRLVGSYPLADTDRILRSLEASLPVRVRQTGWRAWRVEAR